MDRMRKLDYISKDSNPRPFKSFYSTPIPLSHSKNIDDPIALQSRIKNLEKQMENAQLKAVRYELMIEIAEKELKIPIRKKSGTK